MEKRLTREEWKKIERHEWLKQEREDERLDREIDNATAKNNPVKNRIALIRRLFK